MKLSRVGTLVGALVVGALLGVLLGSEDGCGVGCGLGMLLGSADGNDDGPKSVADSFNWALHFIGSMYLLGLLSIGIDLSERLLNRLRTGLQMVTDYSGMGCPEEALRLICKAFEEDVTAGVSFLRAGDVNPICRAVLAAHQGFTAPFCIFGDILQRCPPAILKKVQRISEKMKARARNAMARGMDHKSAMSKYALMFMNKGMEAMMESIGDFNPADCVAHCFKHAQQCRMFPDNGDGQNGSRLRGCVAGKAQTLFFLFTKTFQTHTFSIYDIICA